MHSESTLKISVRERLFSTVAPRPTVLPCILYSRMKEKAEDCVQCDRALKRQLLITLIERPNLSFDS